jgi:hypothetical protein
MATRMKKYKSSCSLSSTSTAASQSTASLSQVGLGTFSPSGDTVITGTPIKMSSSLSTSSFFSGSCEHFDFRKPPGETEQLNVLFACTIHCTASPYSAFEHPAWKAFFRALRGSYQLPCCAVIGGSLMRSEYIETMNEVLIVLGKQPLICFTLDDPTNLQGKQVINMMTCVTKVYFFVHFTMELQRESAVNLLDKLLDCKL